MTGIKPGDVVYAEAASAVLGDVVDVAEDGVTVRWRTTISTEDPDDLTLVIDEDWVDRLDFLAVRLLAEFVIGENRVPDGVLRVIVRDFAEPADDILYDPREGQGSDGQHPGPRHP